MIRKLIIASLVVVGALMLGSCASTVRFKSIPITMHMEPQMLTGKLMKPKGDGPFPAVVMLHGCDGLKDFYRPWATRLRGWGYVTLQVDSFGPRGVSNCWGQNLVNPEKRSLDAHGAKLYLARLPFVDPKRIAVMGWSHGGTTTLVAVLQKSWPLIPGDPFRAGVAFYPWCQIALENLNAPLLVLIGEKDDWTPAYWCKLFMLSEKTEHEIILKVYPGAYHSFDHQFQVHWFMGHWVGCNSAAASAAYEEVKQFLGKHLK